MFTPMGLRIVRTPLVWAPVLVAVVVAVATFVVEVVAAVG
jgi:hypothetical protein